MRALLDVNVLIALLDAGHLHHRVATAWLAAHQRAGWASCPLTQNGCVRLMSTPAYPNVQPAALVAQRLGAAVTDRTHEFWPDDLSLLDVDAARWDRILGPRHVADVYLLALAVRRGGTFVSFDRSIDLAAVPGANARHYTVLGAPN
jgi:toxin-antitoxin system PIN domain toxin